MNMTRVRRKQMQHDIQDYGFPLRDFGLNFSRCSQLKNTTAPRNIVIRHYKTALIRFSALRVQGDKRSEYWKDWITDIETVHPYVQEAQ